MNLIDIISKVAEDSPEKVAILEEQSQITYHDLSEEIDSFARGLSAIGIKPGDRVAVILPNGKEFICAFFSLLKIGAIAVPLQPVYKIREYKEFFEETQPAYIITTPFIFIKVLAYESSFLKEYKYLISESDALIKSKYQDILDFDQIIELGKSKNLPEVSLADNQVASINYTYHGYGYPLGAVLTHQNYIESIEMISQLDFNGGKKYLTALPMAHIFSLVCSVLVPLCKGLTVVIVRSHAAWEFLKAIQEFQIDIIYGVPTFFTYLLKSYDKTKFDISSVKYAISGGSYLSEKLQKKLEGSLGIKFYQGYGLTEGLIISTNRGGKEKCGSLGAPIDGLEVSVYTNEGHFCREADRAGEIAVKGPNVMQGYYKREHETNEVLRDGWLLTGDIGKFDNEGFLYFQGYFKSIAKVGGLIVDLKEVEKVILDYPFVEEVTVFAENDPFWGETVIGEVITTKKVMEEEILNFCNERLAAYKTPKKIKISYKYAGQILIIDSDMKSLESYASALSKKGYKVITADTAYAAVEAINSGFYDLILCDPVLPDKQGKMLLDKIKQADNKLPIIVMSQQSTLLEEIDLDSYNIVEYFDKSTALELLFIKVKAYLKLR